MSKRALHHVWTRLRPIRSQYFLIMAIVTLIIGVIALRQNNLTAIELRDKVLNVDQQDGDVEAALRQLRSHVYTHMNSDLSGGSNNIAQPIQLKYRYERLVTAEKQRVSEANTKIYNDAQQECERLYPAGLSGRGRIPCIEEFVSSRSIKEQPIPDGLYKFDFIAPRWSADLAGLSLALSIFFVLLFLVRFSLERWFRHQFQEHM